jgi:RNA polymerase-binding transcription factor DksA
MDLQTQRQRLVYMLNELVDTGASFANSKKSLKDYNHELTVFDNHPADVATEDYLRNLDATIRENSSHQIDLIQKAISRIDRGEYEKCSSCDNAIDPDRLEALPYVSTCIQCARNSDLGGLTKPTTFPEFREDPTWPKFNQYGTSDSIQDKPRQVRGKPRPD